MLPHVVAVALNAVIGTTVHSTGADGVLRYVVVVTNNRAYEHDLPALQYADDDGALYYELFRPYARRIDLLTNFDDTSQSRYSALVPVARPPTIAELTLSLESVYRQIEHDKKALERTTELLFIFVGHGGVDEEGRGFVHLQDALFRREQLFSTVIARSPAHYTHIIVDACNSYSLLAGRGNQSDADRMRQLERFLAGHELEAYPNVGVLIAATDDNRTHEWSEISAGVFSHQVRSSLRGAADVNGDGLIEYSEVAAFVAAASSELPASKRVAVFAWPPHRDRRAVLMTLNDAPAMRTLEIREGVAGRVFVEESNGNRLVELHVPDYPVRLRLPAGTRLYVRDGEHESTFAEGDEPIRLTRAPEISYNVAERGPVDEAFSKKLFVAPLTEDFYRGYVVGHGELVEVEIKVRSSADRRVQYRDRNVDDVTVGYAVGVPPIMQRKIEHGPFVSARVPIVRSLSVSGQLEAGYVGIEGNRAVLRGSAFCGLRLDVMSRFGIASHVAAEVGYGVVAIRAKRKSKDLSVLTARLRGGLLWPVHRFARVLTGIAVGQTLITVIGNEERRTTGQLFLGMALDL